jgi:hypothetical protein
MEAKVTTAKATRLACGVAILALGAAKSLSAQLEIGTWVRQSTDSMPGKMTMTIESCCNGGRRLTYHVDINGTATLLFVETKLDGNEAPVMMNGKPSGETMAITRVDAHHAATVLRMNGKPFGTSQATLSADGRTLTVLNDFSSSVGSQTVGKSTEVWVKQ